MKELWQQLTAEWAKGEPADRKKIAQLMEKMDELMPSGDGNLELKTLKGQFDQMRAELDVQAKATAELKKAGLVIRGSGIVTPSGRSARLEMLADTRCFLSDETAKRFGAHVVSHILTISGKASLIPSYVKDIADDVAKSAKADMDPNVSASGQALIADEFRAEIIRNVEVVGVLFPQCRRIPLANTGTTTIPKRTGGITAYWTAASTQINRSAPTFDVVQLQPEKLAALTAIPNEFQRSALLIDLGQFLGVEFTYAIADAIDKALVNGDGTAAYGGITGIMNSLTIADVSPTADHDEMSEIVAADVSQVIGEFPKGYALPNAKWGFSLSVLGFLRGLLNATNNLPIYQRGGNGLPNTIDDFPFTVASCMPAKAAVAADDIWGFFGDLRMSHVVGMIRDIEIAQSDAPLFEADMTAVRAIVHLDIQEADSDAIVTAKTHS